MPHTPGKLTVVPTPLGNLGDITLRALEALKECDVVVAEDTRTARKLLSAHGITGKRTESYTEQSALTKSPKLVDAIRRGKKLCLVSEAGTPGISDPGHDLISRVVEEDLPLVVLPGPSVVTTALVASGFPSDSFTYLGFVPQRKARLRKFLNRAASTEHPVVFFVPARRLLEVLDEVVRVMPDRRVCVARELTKIHEELVRGRPGEVGEQLKTRGPVRGEVVVVLDAHEIESSPGREQVVELLEEELLKGSSRRDAVRAVSRKLGMSKSRVYEIALEKFGADGG